MTAAESLCAYSRRMVRDGLVVGTSGNMSVRESGRIAVTPSGVDYETMEPTDVVHVDGDGTVLEGHLRPTSEMPLHLAVHARPGVAAVVHTHSPAAVAVSLLRADVPRVHYQLAMFGGTVPVAEYAPYGTPELARSVTGALDTTGGDGKCRAVVLAHHGTLVVAGDLGTAYDGARQLEWLCDVWLRARAAGFPAELTPDQVDAVVPRFATYGQR